MRIQDDLTAERLALVERLRGLSDEQWGTPSLCSGWTVHHVLAHLTTPFLVSRPAMALRFLRQRGVSSAMDSTARDLARRSPQDLLDVLEQNAASSFAPPGVGLVAPLTDAVVHGVDIRWPLGDPHDDWAAPQRLRPSLDFLLGRRATLGFLPASRPGGLRLVATDQDWSRGTGSDVRGTSLALVLGLLGRRSALDDLTGEGVPVLAGRL